MRKGTNHSEESKNKISESKKGHVSWNKGLTKETDERVRKSGETRKSLYVGKNAPMFGRKFSDEHKKKISESNKGRIVSEETRKKMSESRKGIKLSEETRKKMSESKKGVNNPNYGKFGVKSHLYGKSLSDETKKKMSESKKGNKWTEEQKENLREAIKGKRSGKNNPMYGVHRYGEDAPMYGKHHSEETKKKISEANEGKCAGEKSPFWNPNRAEVYAPYGENFYNKKIRNEKWNLQCGKDMLTGTMLDPNKRPAYHHINYNKSNDDPDNHCFISSNNHSRITNYQSNPIKSERYKKILQENTLSLKNGQIPKYWSQINKELYRQEKLKQLDLSSYII